jgi:hypothetical protein
MKSLLLCLVFGTTTVVALNAQECPVYYPDLKGAVLDYKQYDKKGSLIGSSSQEITDITKLPSSITINIKAESFDAKGKSMGSVNLTARCEGGIYYIDMKGLMGQQNLEAYKDMEMTVTGGNLEIPQNMKAGDMLKSGDMKMAFSSGGMTIMNMMISISNRKVEAVETITTPAGSFECFKISSDMAVKTFVNVKTKSVEWYAKGVGLVKNETYGTDGKLLGSNILNGIKR